MGTPSVLTAVGCEASSMRLNNNTLCRQFGDMLPHDNVNFKDETLLVYEAVGLAERRRCSGLYHWREITASSKGLNLKW